MVPATASPLKSLSLYLVLGSLAIVMLLPLLWLASTALKSPSENIFAFPPQFFPQQPTLENFKRVWEVEPLFGRYFFNSAIVASLTVLFNVILCSLAAYPLARLDFRGRELIFSLVVATIMIPFQIIMIPLYILMFKLGLLNSYGGVILPSLASAFGIFLMRQAFKGVPKELEEAARIDGCSELGIWWHVMLPAVRPATITLALFVFIGAWGDFLWPLIVLRDQEMYTLPLGVSTLASSLSRDERLVAAGSVLSIVPIVVVFLLLQRYILPTQSSSGLKG
ncbi:carbohydrate ABC transporter permease [Prochlorothrix hollandica]|uniref:Sugar ABC transporter permease n=1 Tax=Prochlorothrix hollandica PCC 9006 = CALU 1027 TaxID=317619 RepID=A0A0M2PT59_PROHO|nr:carbohydrate ABC transporter permease [Prochlorothrix hollandica]KKI98342.1 sugar ABC transporter permease [Prochlorothrix hollandica PCC 9006 = CALU 1027]